MTSETPSETNVVEYDANKNAVHAVTVYQENRAEVKRRIKLELKDGQNDVEVKNLPSCIEESSIRVDGIGNATIFDVIYHDPPPRNYNRHEEALRELNDRKSTLEDKLAISTRQTQVVADYAKSLSASHTTSDQLEAFLDVYASRQQRINEEVTKLKNEIKAVEKEINDKRASLSADDESLDMRGARVTIIVFAEGAGEAELSLVYVVSGASWTPRYDLRASIAPDTKTESTVKLHYRAAINQSTGENWNDVSLTLSTASPLIGTTIPTLNPQWVSERVPYQPAAPRFKTKSMKHSATPSWRSRRARSRSASIGEEDMGTAMVMRTAYVDRTSDLIGSTDFGAGFGGAASPRLLRPREAEASDGAVSKTFTIPGLSNIPNSSPNNQQTHKVSISELDFSTVELEWIAVPKSITSAFLQGRVRNTSDYILLSGEANVFLNGNFVAKSNLPHVSPQESFFCSLGVDPAVRITYHPQRKKTKISGGSVLTTRTTTTSYEQTMTIKNTRLTTLDEIIVKDQIPVSSDARIKVNVIEPKHLAEGKGKTVILGEGVQARWAPKNNDASFTSKTGAVQEVDAESAGGIIEWSCNIEPGVAKDIVFAWEVTAPNNVRWTT